MILLRISKKLIKAQNKGFPSPSKKVGDLILSHTNKFKSVVRVERSRKGPYRSGGIPTPEVGLSLLKVFTNTIWVIYFISNSTHLLCLCSSPRNQ